jgi:hypothetical protein
MDSNAVTNQPLEMASSNDNSSDRGLHEKTFYIHKAALERAFSCTKSKVADGLPIQIPAEDYQVASEIFGIYVPWLYTRTFPSPVLSTDEFDRSKVRERSWLADLITWRKRLEDKDLFLHLSHGNPIHPSLETVRIVYDATEKESVVSQIYIRYVNQGGKGELPEECSGQTGADFCSKSCVKANGKPYDQAGTRLVDGVFEPKALRDRYGDPVRDCDGFWVQRWIESLV